MGGVLGDCEGCGPWGYKFQGVLPFVEENTINMKISPQDVLQALSTIKDPDLNRDIVSLGFIKELQVEDSRVSFTLQLTTPACPVREQLVAAAKQAVEALGVRDVQVRLTSHVTSGRGPKLELIPQVKNTVAVASGNAKADFAPIRSLPVIARRTTTSNSDYKSK